MSDSRYLFCRAWPQFAPEFPHYAILNPLPNAELLQTLDQLARSWLAEHRVKVREKLRARHRQRCQAMAAQRLLFTAPPNRRAAGAASSPPPKRVRQSFAVRVAELAGWTCGCGELEFGITTPTERIFLPWPLPESEANALAEALEREMKAPLKEAERSRDPLAWTLVEANLRFGVVPVKALSLAEQATIEAAPLEPDSPTMPRTFEDHVRVQTATRAEHLLKIIREKMTPGEGGARSAAGKTETAGSASTPAAAEGGAQPAGEAATAPGNSPPPTATHSPDFTSVNWFGMRYTFAKGNQAEAVRHLWAAWESGGHSLSQETIGERIESDAVRFVLKKVFREKKSEGGYKPHPAWGTMIQQESKGAYRLAAPAPPPPKAAETIPK